MFRYALVEDVRNHDKYIVRNAGTIAHGDMTDKVSFDDVKSLSPEDFTGAEFVVESDPTLILPFTVELAAFDERTGLVKVFSQPDRDAAEDEAIQHQLDEELSGNTDSVFGPKTGEPVLDEKAEKPVAPKAAAK